VSDKYEFIDGEKENYPIARMCSWSKVSRSGFYSWRSRPSSATTERRATLKTIIRRVFEDADQTYGYRRVHAQLARLDVPAGPELVRALMRELGLVPCQPRPWRLTTVSDAAAPDTPDLVARDFTADAPGRKLVGDITYVATWQGFLYLATVIDCHTRAVIGWATADHMKTTLISDAIDMAARNTDLREGCIFHSDKGSQGGFNRSSQHLDVEVLHGQACGVDYAVHRAVGDAFAGSSAASAGGGAGLLGEGRRGLDQRGRGPGVRCVRSGRLAMVPQGWRHAAAAAGPAFGQIPVVRRA